MWQYLYIKILEISSVSFVEYVKIVGMYNGIVHKPEIDTRLLSRGYSEEALKQMQSKLKGSVKELISLDLQFKSGLDYSYPYFNYIMSLFDKFDKNGTMPFDGPYADQPNKIIEIFSILEQLKVERENRHREEQQREAKRNQNRKRK